MNNKLKRKSCENNVQLRPTSKKTERERKGCNHIPSEKRLKHANNENLFSKYLLGYICQSKDTSDICQPQNFCVKNGYISVGLSVDISIGLKSLSVEN